MFEINSSKKIFHANYIEEIFNEQTNETFPYVVRTTKNNGVRGFIKENPAFLNPENTLSFAQDTFSVFYQKQKFYTGNKVKILLPKFKNQSESVMNFLTASFQKSLNTFTWGVGSTVDSIAKTPIVLPIKNGKIDFEFIDNFIVELETERIKKVEQYLLNSGLKDYKLSFEEEKVLNDYENQIFEEFKVTDVFDVKNTKNILSRDIIENSGKIPYLCASTENNAISTYISFDEKYLDKGNCVFIGGKTFVVTYQENDFYSNDSHNLALYLQGSKGNRLNQLYLASCINKSLGYKYSWGDSISNSKIQTDKVSLPIVNKKRNYEIMETFISAIQKLVIKDVILHINKKLEITTTSTYRADS